MNSNVYILVSSCLKWNVYINNLAWSMSISLISDQWGLRSIQLKMQWCHCNIHMQKYMIKDRATHRKNCINPNAIIFVISFSKNKPSHFTIKQIKPQNQETLALISVLDKTHTLALLWLTAFIFWINMPLSYSQSWTTLCIREGGGAYLAISMLFFVLLWQSAPCLCRICSLGTQSNIFHRTKGL